MGKDWYWSSSKSSICKRAVSEKDSVTSGCMSSVFQFFDFHHFQFPLNSSSSSSSSSFKPTTTNSFLPEDHHHHHSGVEAPRNSLELQNPPQLASLSTTTCFKEKEEEDNLNISMGSIQIKTRSSSSCSEISSSPGAKTPNLVARLMGLDLLPNEPQQSPNLSTNSNFHHHHHFRTRQQQNGKLISHRHSVDVDIIKTAAAGGGGGGTRSLPETPRISSARRSDVDHHHHHHHHHRLSLQINKENDDGDEYRSPISQHARQILKQVKESVSRKVGLDITNTVRINREKEDEAVSCQLKAKKISRVFNQSSPGKHSTPSCSPRLSRFLEPKQNININPSNSSSKEKSSSTSSSSSSSQAQADNNNVNIQPQPIKVFSSKSKLELEEQHMLNEKRPDKRINNKRSAAGEKKFISSRLKRPPQTTDIIRNKQEEPFVRRPSAAGRSNIISPDKKCKQTPLSNDLLNITVPTLLPVKKVPSPPATKLPKKEVLNAQNSKRSSLLSNNTCQTYKQKATPPFVAQGKNNQEPIITNVCSTATASTVVECDYITRILKFTGISKDTQVSFTKWFSPSHPLDPNIFHHLENMNNPITISGQLSHYSNRKLMFELVDEILVDILKPYIKMKPWVSSRDYYGDHHHHHVQGSELIEMLCNQVRSYPRADCQVLEDIDGLIDRDLTKMLKMQKRIEFEEEGEGLVMEIEKDILDTLIHETAMELN